MKELEIKDYTKECQKIMKQCKLTFEDLTFIQEQTKATNPEELYYELEEMLKNNQIRIGG